MTFVNEMRTRTGRTAPEAARAYTIVRDVFDLRPLWTEIEGLDNKVTAAVQIDMLLEIIRLIEHAAAWLLLRGDSISAARSQGSHRALAPSPRRWPSCCRRATRTLSPSAPNGSAEAGVPETLAGRIAAFTFLAGAFDIGELAERSAQPLDRAARIYWGAGVRFALDEMRTAARRLPAETSWQKLAVEAMIDDLFALQADLAARILASDYAADPDPLVAWSATNAASLAPPTRSPVSCAQPQPPILRCSSSPAASCGIRSGDATSRFIRFSTNSSTTLGSARVVTSPSASCSFAAILRKMRRMILPERVFGRPGAHCNRSGGSYRADFLAHPGDELAF